MIRKNKTNSEEHLYRVIVPEAFRIAWARRYVWPLALFAGVLFTGGIYDVLLSTFREAESASIAVTTGGIPPALVLFWKGITTASNAISVLGLIQSVTVAVLIVATVVGISIISQGALIFGIGGKTGNRAPLFTESLAVGAHYAWRIFALNAITLSLAWLAKFLFIIPYGLSQTNPTASLQILTIIGSSIFAFITIALAAIHFFALSAIILEDAHITQALEQALKLLKKGWLNVLELGSVLLLVGAGLLIAGLIAFVLMALPMILLMAVAAVMNINIGVYIGFILFTLLFLSTSLIAGMLAVTFQYAAWHQLYVRLGKGEAIPKIHRLWFSLTRSSQA